MKIVFDIDAILFDAVSVSESRFITVTHGPTGQVMEFENRSELWGNFRTKTDGWIGMRNKLSGTDYYKATDFEIVDGQRPRPFRVKGKVIGEDENGNPVRAPDTFLSPSDGAKQIIDDKIAAICAKLKCGSYFGYTGTGKVFRHDLATLLPYKGNRGDSLTPLLLKEMKQYVCDHHNCTMVENIEADDAVSMATVAGYKAWKEGGKKDVDKVICCQIDKDGKQTEGWRFNHTKDAAPHLIEGLGSLWMDAKGNPDGEGRMFLYWQVLHGDECDGFKASCFSSKKYGGKGAYNDLKDCTTDKEAFEVMVAKFKWMYPDKKTVITFRGETEIDWLYVMVEMFNMALMLRHEGDKIDVKAVLVKLGVEH